MGNFLPGNEAGVDKRLISIIRGAAEASPYTVKITSGKRAYNPKTGTPNHPGGWATDVAVSTDGGKTWKSQGLGNKAATPFYQDFARYARQVQTSQFPELNGTFRWGGHFGGRWARDNEHFDITPGMKGAMSLGGWDSIIAGHPVPPADIPGSAASPAGTAQPALRYTPGRAKMSGPAVADVQRKLAAAGFDPGNADGIYGPKTAAAVRAFENATPGLTVDKGIVGPQVREALSHASPVPVSAGIADMIQRQAPRDLSIANPNPPQRLQEGTGVVQIPDRRFQEKAAGPGAGLSSGMLPGGPSAPQVLPQGTPTPWDIAAIAPVDTVYGKQGLRNRGWDSVRGKDTTLPEAGPAAISPDPNTFGLDRRREERRGAARGALQAARAADGQAAPSSSPPVRRFGTTDYFPENVSSADYTTGVDGRTGAPAPDFFDNYGPGVSINDVGRTLANAPSDIWNWATGGSGAAPAAPSNDYQGYIPGGYGAGRQDQQQQGSIGGAQYADAGGSPAPPSWTIPSGWSLRNGDSYLQRNDRSVIEEPGSGPMDGSSYGYAGGDVTPDPTPSYAPMFSGPSTSPSGFGGIGGVYPSPQPASMFNQYPGSYYAPGMMPTPQGGYNQVASSDPSFAGRSNGPVYATEPTWQSTIGYNGGRNAPDWGQSAVANVVHPTQDLTPIAAGDAGGPGNVAAGEHAFAGANGGGDMAYAPDAGLAGDPMAASAAYDASGLGAPRVAPVAPAPAVRVASPSVAPQVAAQAYGPTNSGYGSRYQAPANWGWGNSANAARSAGYTTGIASPQYAQIAASRGYSAPADAFTPGSGGAIYAYHANGQGGGTYVDSQGREHTY